MKKRLFSILLSLALIISMIPAEMVMAADTGGYEKIVYCDENGNEKYCENYEVIDREHTSFNADNDLWLVFDGEKINLPQISLIGKYTYNLIIRDNQEITINGGIYVERGSLVMQHSVSPLVHGFFGGL